MRKLLISLVFLAATILPSTSALAFDTLKQACTSNSDASSSGVCQDTSGTNTLYGTGGLFDKIINLISIIIGIVAVFAIVVAGFMFITSGGDSQRVSTARNTILYVIVGLVVVAVAQLIEAFVINSLGSPQ